MAEPIARTVDPLVANRCRRDSTCTTCKVSTCIAGSEAVAAAAQNLRSPPVLDNSIHISICLCWFTFHLPRCPAARIQRPPSDLGADLVVVMSGVGLLPAGMRSMQPPTHLVAPYNIPGLHPTRSFVRTPHRMLRHGAEGRSRSAAGEFRLIPSLTAIRHLPISGSHYLMWQCSMERQQVVICSRPC